MGEKLDSPLDLKSQNTLIQVLSSLIDENEKLSLANQEFCSDNCDIQAITDQINVQQLKLNTILASNRKLEQEIMKAQKLFQDKLDSIQPYYQKVLQKKTELQLSQETKIKQLFDAVEALKIEDKLLDEELEKLTNESAISRNMNIRLQLSESPAAIESERLATEIEDLIESTSAQIDSHSQLVTFNADVYMSAPTQQDIDSENLVE